MPCLSTYLSFLASSLMPSTSYHSYRQLTWRRRRRYTVVLISLAFTVLLLVYFAWFDGYERHLLKLFSPLKHQMTTPTTTTHEGNIRPHAPVGGVVPHPGEPETGIEPDDAVVPVPNPMHNTTTVADEDAKTPRILLVSAFYPLPKSKHKDDEYRRWMRKFLGRITTDVYFFTTPEMEPLVQSAAATTTTSTSSAKGRRLTVNTTYSTPFAIPPLGMYKTKYEEMHEWDREKDRHAPELYAIWNAKPWFLVEGWKNAVKALDSEPDSTYDYIFWMDAGSFRHDHTYEVWPDPSRALEVWEEAFWLRTKELERENERTQKGNGENGDGEERVKGRKEDLIFIPVFEIPTAEQKNWKEDKGPIDMDFSEGTFFGSSPESMSWYASIFYAYHNYYITTPPSAPTRRSPPRARAPQSVPQPKFHFVGKDQTLINALLFLYPERFFTVVSPSHWDLLPAHSPGDDSQTHEHGAASPFWQSLKRLKLKAEQKAWEAWRGVFGLKPAPSSSSNSTTTDAELDMDADAPTPQQGGLCGDEWFYYQFWLSSAVERQRMRIKWVEHMSWVERIYWGVNRRVGDHGVVGTDVDEANVKSVNGCPVMRVLTLESVLKSVFGDEWVGPRPFGSVAVSP